MSGKKFIYDIKMANFYMQKGAVCIGTGIHKETGNVFWCFKFEGTEKIYDQWCKLCETM